MSINDFKTVLFGNSTVAIERLKDFYEDWKRSQLPIETYKALLNTRG
jgi:hypothetical protein